MVADTAYATTYFEGHEIISYLNGLVAAAHKTIYTRKKPRFSTIFHWFWVTVPNIFRSHLSYFGLSLGIFLLFSVIGFVGSEYIPDGEAIFLHFSLTQPAQAFHQNSSYISRTENYIRQGRPFRIYEEEEKVALASGIMFNNIQVAFFCFVGGIFAGLVTFWLLSMTGMMLGAFFHIFYRHGIILDFWNTIMLHGLIELTMVVMSGMAGFMIAKGVLFPGNFTFADSLKKAGKKALHLAIVIGLWLIIAGIQEGFITGALLLPWAKLLINFASLLLLIIYFCLSGFKKNSSLLSTQA